jgi:uncharacterized protein (DUF488 family)
MILFTVGFTKKSAEDFFSLLSGRRVARVVDVRLNNASQLAGFTKKDDLRFFLRKVCGIDYLHLPQFSPSPELFHAYKQTGLDWKTYERRFLQLMIQRRVEKTVSRDLMDGSCLLCAEPTPEHCHRRLVAEYLRKKWRDVEIIHL